MGAAALLDQTVKRFETLADPKAAEGARRFFREPVDPYGIRNAALGQLEREVYRELKAWAPGERNRFCTELWKTGKLEAGALICHVYRRFEKQCGAAEFALFEKWLDLYVRNWAHTDGVCGWLIAASIANEPALIERLPPWTESENRWKRRAAAVSLIQEAKHGRNTDTILALADRLVKDSDQMVQKGVGWLLKETYPKKPRETLAFLLTRRGAVSRLTVRYAAEKMTNEDRRSVMVKNSANME